MNPDGDETCGSSPRETQNEYQPAWSADGHSTPSRATGTPSRDLRDALRRERRSQGDPHARSGTHHARVHRRRQKSVYGHAPDAKHVRLGPFTLLTLTGNGTDAGHVQGGPRGPETLPDDASGKPGRFVDNFCSMCVSDVFTTNDERRMSAVTSDFGNNLLIRNGTLTGGRSPAVTTIRRITFDQHEIWDDERRGRAPLQTSRNKTPTKSKPPGAARARAATATQ